MGKCERCEGDSGLSYNCNECGGTFCTEHRLPEAHNCEALRTTSPGWFDDSDDTETQDDKANHNQQPTESATCLDCDRVTEQTCDDCGGVYCKRHKAPRAHSCAFLGSDIGPDKDENTEPANCQECGRVTENTCRECGDPYCTQHKKPRTHNCEFHDDPLHSPRSDDPNTSIAGRLQAILLLPVVLLTTAVRSGTRLLTAPIRNPKLGVVVLLLAAGGLATTGHLDGLADALDNDLNEDKVERLVHERVNEIRTERGLSPLHHDPALRTIASKYSKRMATEGFYGHTDPSGDNVEYRYRDAGYSCRVSTGGNRYATGGENINIVNAFVDTAGRNGAESYQADTEEEVAEVIVRQWMNSQGHRENILEPYWDDEGIGIYAIENPDGPGLKVYATQNFC